MTNELLSHIKKNGHKPTVLSRNREKPINLDEQSGVSVGLLILTLKPLRKIRRIERILSRVSSMEPEEAYYWYSKCTETNEGRRAQRALRILLSEE
jgi:hypothetical protein